MRGDKALESKQARMIQTALMIGEIDSKQFYALQVAKLDAKLISCRLALVVRLLDRLHNNNGVAL